MRRTFGGGAADQVAVVGHRAETRPDLLTVDDPLVTIAHGLCLQRREIGAGVGFGHADAPHALSGEDGRQILGLLIGATVGDECRTHLTIGEPHRADGCAGADEFFADDQAIDRRTSTATELLRPGETDPAARTEFGGEVLRPTVDPRVVGAAVLLDGLGRHLAGLLTKGELLVGPGEFHGQSLADRGGRPPTSAL